MQIASAPPSSAPDADTYRDFLAELIGIGMEVARLVQAETRALAAEDRGEADPAHRAAAVAHLATAFDKASRAVRRTVHLARHIDDGADLAGARIAARRRIIRGVEDAIQRTTSGERSETLYAELRERLDGPDLDDDLRRGHPAASLVADICRDLGIEAMPGTHPWKRRTPSDIATLCKLAGAMRPARPANANLGWTGAAMRPVHVQPNAVRLE